MSLFDIPSLIVAILPIIFHSPSNLISPPHMLTTSSRTPLLLEFTLDESLQTFSSSLATHLRVTCYHLISRSLSRFVNSPRAKRPNKPHKSRQPLVSASRKVNQPSVLLTSMLVRTIPLLYVIITSHNHWASFHEQIVVFSSTPPLCPQPSLRLLIPTIHPFP